MDTITDGDGMKRRRRRRRRRKKRRKRRRDRSRRREWRVHRASKTGRGSEWVVSSDS